MTKKANKYNHLMLDIETMGNESFSAIVSIGAVEFNIINGEIGREFYVKIDLESCAHAGLVMHPSTVLWWLQQSEKARAELISDDSMPIGLALTLFSKFCNKDYQVWGNSARFDCGILQNAYNKLGLPIPWDFRKERCVRTLVSFAPEIKANTPSVGIAHNAVDDCKYQIAYCSATWQHFINVHNQHPRIAI